MLSQTPWFITEGFFYVSVNPVIMLVEWSGNGKKMYKKLVYWRKMEKTLVDGKAGEIWK